MTRPIPRLITLAISLLIGVLAANHVLASDYHPINALARKIHSRAKSLKNEARHYRHTPNYKRILHTVVELERVACHLRDTAKHKGDIDHLAADIAEIENHLKHVQYLFDHTDLSVSRYGHGFIKARTSRVKRLLHDIEKAITRICEDIANLQAAINFKTHDSWIHQNSVQRQKTKIGQSALQLQTLLSIHELSIQPHFNVAELIRSRR